MAKGPILNLCLLWPSFCLPEVNFADRNGYHYYLSLFFARKLSFAFLLNFGDNNLQNYAAGYLSLVLWLVKGIPTSGHFEGQMTSISPFLLKSLLFLEFHHGALIKLGFYYSDIIIYLAHQAILSIERGYSFRDTTDGVAHSEVSLAHSKFRPKGEYQIYNQSNFLNYDIKNV
ncbi:hypothetical protein ACJX0J_023443 [Zea mays]